MIDFRLDDVEYTVKIHSEELNKENRQNNNIGSFFEEGYDEFNKSRLSRKYTKERADEAAKRLFYSAPGAHPSKDALFDYNKSQQKYRKILCQGIMHDYHKSQDEEEEDGKHD